MCCTTQHQDNLTVYYVKPVGNEFRVRNESSIKEKVNAYGWQDEIEPGIRESSMTAVASHCICKLICVVQSDLVMINLPRSS